MTQSTPGHGESPPAPEPSWSAAEAGEASPHTAFSASPAPVGDLEDSQATYIRPYAWTGGRTRSSHQLELETLVSVSEMCHPDRLKRTEHHTIAEIGKHPRSVAEVGALLEVPLGVAKVLISDMADLGLITVHDTVSDSTSSSHFLLMKRVLSRLRRL